MNLCKGHINWCSTSKVIKPEENMFNGFPKRFSLYRVITIYTNWTYISKYAPSRAPSAPNNMLHRQSRVLMTCNKRNPLKISSD